MRQPPTHQLQRHILQRLILLALLGLTGLTGCKSQQALTHCHSKSACPSGTICAKTTQKDLKVCVYLPSRTLANNTPNPSRQTNPSTPIPHTTTIAPKQLDPKDCIAPPYKPAQDKGNGGRKVRMDRWDKALFAGMRKIYYASRRCHDRIWGGKYKMHLIPSYLVNIGNKDPNSQKGVRGFLFNNPNPPLGAILVDSRQTQGIQGVYLYQKARNKVTPPGFAFTLPIGSVRHYAMVYGAREPYVPSSKRFLRLFVHEGFHRAQDIEENWRAAKGDQDIAAYSYNKRDIGLILLEQRVLARAYTKGSPQAARQALTMFFAIRTTRILSDQSGRRLIENYDNFQEHLEGTAMYAEDAFSQAIGIPFGPKALNSIIARLLLFETLAKEADANFALGSISSRAYGTGAALGVLLDRIGDTTWKGSIRQGRTFYQHLQRMLPLTPDQRKRLVEQAKRSHQFTELLPLAKQYANGISALLAQQKRTGQSDTF